jgi:hypothetical protein
LLPAEQQIAIELVGERLVESQSAASIEHDGDGGRDVLGDTSDAKRVVGAELPRVVAGQAASRADPASVDSRELKSGHGAGSPGADLRLERLF